MKKLILSIALLSSVIAAKAQTMYIWQKGVGIAVNEGRAGDIQFSADGTAFTVPSVIVPFLLIYVQFL